MEADIDRGEYKGRQPTALNLGHLLGRYKRDITTHKKHKKTISRFFVMGLSVPEAALIAGHKNVRTLLRYTHLKTEDVVSKLA